MKENSSKAEICQGKFIDNWNLSKKNFTITGYDVTKLFLYIMFKCLHVSK